MFFHFQNCHDEEANMRIIFNLFFLLISIYSLGQNCSITIIFPFESEVFIPGYTYNIKWDYSIGCPNYLKIELYRDEEYLLTITNKTENNGEFEWMVPLDMPFPPEIPNFNIFHKYKIKIKDESTLNIIGVSSFFTIYPKKDIFQPFSILPVVANQKGANNSHWKTNFWIWNNYEYEDIGIYLFFYKE